MTVRPLNYIARNLVIERNFSAIAELPWDFRRPIRQPEAPIEAILSETNLSAEQKRLVAELVEVQLLSASLKTLPEYICSNVVNCGLTSCVQPVYEAKAGVLTQQAIKLPWRSTLHFSTPHVVFTRNFSGGSKEYTEETKQKITLAQECVKMGLLKPIHNVTGPAFSCCDNVFANKVAAYCNFTENNKSDTTLRIR